MPRPVSRSHPISSSGAPASVALRRHRPLFVRRAGRAAALWALLAWIGMVQPASARGPDSSGLPAGVPGQVEGVRIPGGAPKVGSLGLLMEAASDTKGKAPPGAARCLPFQEGERLEYVLEWMGIDVGRAVFEVAADGSFHKRPSWRFGMHAETTSWADRIYRVRDKMTAWAEPGMGRALGHEKTAREGSYHRDIRLDLDWRQKRVVYNNQWRAFPPQPLHDDTWDPLGLLYAFRLQPQLGKGNTPMSVTDGLKTIRANVRNHGRETIEIGGRKVVAWKVEPEMKDVGGIFERSPGARMEVWVSDDGRHLPLRLRSAVVVGSFTATLVKAQNLAPDRPGCHLDLADAKRTDILSTSKAKARGR